MIPIFPRFKRLALKDKKEIQRFTSLFPPHSDYNFSSLWSYNVKDDIMISQLHDNLVVKFRDYLTNEQFFSFIGKNQIVKTVNLLINHAKDHDIKSQLLLIPEDNLISVLNFKNKLQIREDPDNHDYILSLKEHANIIGEKYSRHRKSISRFKRKFPKTIVKIIDLKKKKIKKQIIELFNIWSQQNEKTSKEIKYELIALKRILAHPNYLNLLGFGLYHNSNLISFLIVDVSHSEYVESHFLKTHHQYPGAAHTVRHFSSKYLYKMGFKYLNIEQDMGLAGLRFTKTQWKPTHYLKKYAISIL